MNFTLTPSPGIPVRVLDAYSPKEAIEEVITKKNCVKYESAMGKDF